MKRCSTSLSKGSAEVQQLVQACLEPSGNFWCRSDGGAGGKRCNNPLSRGSAEVQNTSKHALRVWYRSPVLSAAESSRCVATLAAERQAYGAVEQPA